MKASLKIIGLSIVLGSLAMGSTYKRPKEIIGAIGSFKGIPKAMERALTPDKAFEPLPEPEEGEWLAIHPEPGQTFDQFVRSDPYRPDAKRNKIYLQPLGVFVEARSPDIETLRAYARAFLSWMLRCYLL
jgi:hypothetical protein